MAVSAAIANNIILGPGILLRAPLATAVPTHTVVGSKFTDVWAAAWVPIGVTDSGHEWTYQPSTGQVTVAEYLVPMKIVTTGVTIGVSFSIAEVSAKNVAWSLNGGSYSLVSGTTTTSLSKVSPPTLGQEVRTMIGWESDDGTERVIWYQCFQGGAVKIPHHKGADNAVIPVDWQVEQPASGNPFDIWYAGATRIGV